MTRQPSLKSNRSPAGASWVGAVVGLGRRGFGASSADGAALIPAVDGSPAPCHSGAGSEGRGKFAKFILNGTGGLRPPRGGTQTATSWFYCSTKARRHWSVIGFIK